MLYKINLLTIFFISTFSIAQNADAEIVIEGNTMNIAGKGNLSNGFWVKSSSIKKEVVGTDYMVENWAETVELHDVKNKSYKIPNSNFNITHNRLESKIGDDKKAKTFIFDKKNVNDFVLQNHLFVKKQIDKKITYVESLSNEVGVNLYKYYFSEVIEAAFNTMTQKKMGKDKIVIKTKYYLEKQENVLTELKFSKSGIIKSLSNSTELKKYIKSNHLKMKEEKEFIDVLHYYNTI